MWMVLALLGRPGSGLATQSEGERRSRGQREGGRRQKALLCVGRVTGGQRRQLSEEPPPSLAAVGRVQRRYKGGAGRLGRLEAAQGKGRFWMLF